MTDEEKAALCDLIAFDIKTSAIMGVTDEDTDMEASWWLFDTDMSLDDSNNLTAARESFPDGLSLSRT